MATDNAPELVEALRQDSLERLLVVEQGTAIDAIQDRFKDADEVTFLEKNAELVQNTGKNEGNLDAFIGALEENAFLASFQNTRALSNRPRLKKWATAYSILKADSSTNGIMNKQLKFVGINVEEQFISQILRLKSAGTPST